MNMVIGTTTFSRDLTGLGYEHGEAITRTGTTSGPTVPHNANVNSNLRKTLYGQAMDIGTSHHKANTRIGRIVYFNFMFCGLATPCEGTAHITNFG